MKTVVWRNVLLSLALVALCTSLLGTNAWANNGSFGTGFKEPTEASVTTSPMEWEESFAEPSFSTQYGYDVAHVDDCDAYISTPGQPILPFRTVSILLPPGVSSVDVGLEDIVTTRVEGSYYIAPAQQPVTNDQTASPTEPDTTVYSLSTKWPQEVYEVVGVSKMRQYNILVLRVYPLSYVPAERDVYLNSYIRLSISWSAGQSGIHGLPAVLYSSRFKAMVEGIVSNPQVVNNYVFSSTSHISASQPSEVGSLATGNPAKYVIVTPSSFASAAQPLADWKSNKGITARVFSLEDIVSGYTGDDDAEKMKNFINDCYTTWGTEWVLLAGDVDYVPTRDIYCPDGHDQYVPSDYYFADLTGDWDSDGDHKYGERHDDDVDWAAEVFVGRLPARTSAELSMMVDKIIDYEQNPPAGDWRNRMLLCGAYSNYQDEEGRTKTDEAKLKEEIRTDLLPAPITYTRLYEEAGLDPTDYAHEYALTFANVQTELAEGYVYVNFAGHGSSSGIYRKVWTSDKDNDNVPDSNEMSWYTFISTDTTLSNGEKLSLIYGDACSSAQIDVATCFGEYLVKSSNGGAIGYIGATRVSWYRIGWDHLGDGYNQDLDYRFWQEYLGDPGNCPGEALYMSKLWYANTHGTSSYQHRKNLFTYVLLGDPEVRTPSYGVTYDLTMAVSGNGTTSPSVGVHTYSEGTLVNITATPDSGWEFVNWTGDVADANSASTTVTMDADKTVTANFTQVTTHDLTMAASGNGTTTPVVGVHTYNEGTVVDITATADPGWTFGGWSGDLSGSSNPESITMNADKFVTATFIQDQYTLTVNVVGNGSVAKDPDQATYTYGTTVGLTATADPSWTFAGWSGDLSGSSNSESITMDADKSVTATFIQDQYTLTVNVVGNGSVAKDPDQSTYTYGTTVGLTATTDPGWTFAGWSGDLSGSSNSESITMDADKSVTANFAQVTHELTMAVSGNGTTSPSVGVHTYSEGTLVNITATPDSGWEFVNWTGDVADANSASTTVTMDADKTVTANFEIAPFIDQIATGEVSVDGSVAGSYIDTHADDGVVESITEITTRGRPQNRHSYLDHKWTFNVEAGTTVTFSANVWAPASSDGDTFEFSYSIDDVVYTPMFVIAAVSDDTSYQSYELPHYLAGTVYVRVIDTDSTPGNLSLDTLYVDHIFIRTNNISPEPPAAPTGLTATATSGSQIDLSWTDNADNELGFYIECSPDGTNWAQIDEVGSNVINYSDTGLAPGTTYWYRVQAYNSADTSDYSNSASATTDEVNSIHVGDLDGSSLSSKKSRWDATVSILILDAEGQPVSGATVTGFWSDGATGSSSAVTGADGWCQITKSNIKSNVNSVKFTITNVQHDSDIYDSGSNEDPDPDSDGTTIMVSKP